jgi:hypothetical protein
MVGTCKRGRIVTGSHWHAAGQWTPSAIAANKRAPDDNRTRALIAERDNWIREVGLIGWQRELNGRRAARLTRYKRRTERTTP